MIRTHPHTSFGPLFSGVANPTWPVQASWTRPEAVPQPAARPAGQARLTRAVDLLLGWSERARQRRELMQFDDHLLRDIGITRAEAIAEAAKPFWRS
jgi:uncharacterized protein YjiS (DUF1127 family)